MKATVTAIKASRKNCYVTFKIIKSDLTQEGEGQIKAIIEDVRFSNKKLNLDISITEDQEQDKQIDLFESE